MQKQSTLNMYNCGIQVLYFCLFVCIGFMNTRVWRQSVMTAFDFGIGIANSDGIRFKPVQVFLNVPNLFWFC